MINVAVIAGHLTKDVELSKTHNGNSVAKFTVAVNGINDNTDFINCVAWNKLADIVNMYCKKGDLVTVEGRISVRNYENQQGQKVYITEVVANNVQLPPKNASNGQNYNSNINTYQQPNQAYNNTYGVQNTYTQPSLTQQIAQQEYNDGSGLQIASDDLPF
jgi:single-strand DNA-binding protein